MFSIVKVVTSLCKGLSFLTPGGRKMRDPGNEVVTANYIDVLAKVYYLLSLLSDVPMALNQCLE